MDSCTGGLPARAVSRGRRPDCMSVPVSTLSSVDLTGTQARTLDDLIRRGYGASFDRTLRGRLAEYIREGVTGLHVQGMSLNKQALKSAEQCPGRLAAYLHGEEHWEMTPEFAVGRVLHRAVEVEAGSREALPLHDVVDHAIARLLADRFQVDFSDFWNSADEPTRAEVRGGAVTALEMFRATFPPLWAIRREMPPVPELPLTYELASGLRIAGRVDLCLGAVVPHAATRLPLDLKTGGGSRAYPEDMRLYALLHTLRYEAPPYRVATVFLPSGTWQPEDITEEMLFRAADRVVSAASLASALLFGQGDPDLTPGPHCGRCPRRSTCPAAVL